jgi:hypothetical protein
MRSPKLRIVSSLFSFALFTAPVVPLSTAGAQSAIDPEEEKEANDMRKLAARAKETEPFFAATEPLEVAITTNIRRIRADKEDKAPWRPATITYTDAAGKKIEVPMRLRTRGIWRLKNCEFPPLRMNFRHEETKGTLLSGLDKPKLVNFCENADAHENYILQEMQLYRIYNLLTPASHRARLLKVSYIDSASGKTHAQRLAILVEEPETMAARLGSPLVEIKGATTTDLDSYGDALVGVFQYMIGNTDWSTYGLHNMELVRQEDGDYIPIPYDFDFAGAIDAPYATPDPKLKLARVRQRLFRGFCHEEPEFQKVFSLFNEKKDAIYALYTDPIGRALPKKTVAETLGYFDEFYQTINDSKRARNLIVDKCVKIR